MKPSHEKKKLRQSRDLFLLFSILIFAMLVHSCQAKTCMAVDVILCSHLSELLSHSNNLMIVKNEQLI